jgi:hypothetical protein
MIFLDMSHILVSLNLCSNHIMMCYRMIVLWRLPTANSALTKCAWLLGRWAALAEPVRAGQPRGAYRRQLPCAQELRALAARAAAMFLFRAGFSAEAESSVGFAPRLTYNPSENREIKLLSLINSLLAHVYGSILLSNHELIRLKNTSHKLQISYFCLYLILNECVQLSKHLMCRF